MAAAGVEEFCRVRRVILKRHKTFARLCAHVTYPKPEAAQVRDLGGDVDARPRLCSLVMIDSVFDGIVLVLQ